MLTHHRFILKGEIWDVRARAQAAKEPNAVHSNIQPRYSFSSLLRHNHPPKPLRGNLESHNKGQHPVSAQAGNHHAHERSHSWWRRASPSVCASEAFRTAEDEEPRFRKRLGNRTTGIFALLPSIMYPTLIFVCPSPPSPHAGIYSQAPASPTVTCVGHGDTHCLAQHHLGGTICPHFPTLHKPGGCPAGDAANPIGYQKAPRSQKATSSRTRGDGEAHTQRFPAPTNSKQQVLS